MSWHFFKSEVNIISTTLTPNIHLLVLVSLPLGSWNLLQGSIDAGDR